MHNHLMDRDKQWIAGWLARNLFKKNAGFIRIIKQIIRWMMAVASLEIS